ncbi:hypothetical protein FHP88_15760 [Sedimenticola selenatireducens]|uniref:Uncharacterized protein n=1 Tax=Sedimenticola selenatireducens TaxID=191960 RepID=A0A557S0J2_9GAMM|nr:DUF1799 domain-containing protein [Sedimenticola selenatireducens]TVO70909.1 hypothetical protein FHP88_15760 [Sedimenticola selenatireducens]
MDADLAAMNAPDEIRQKVQVSSDDFYVLEENWTAVMAWLTVQTQMTRTGFRYEGMEAGLRMATIESTPEIFSKLQVMEGAVLAVWNNHST